MPETSVGTTPGAGANLHGWQRAITGLTTPIDEFVIPGEFPYPTYVLNAESITVATINDDVVQLMAAASVNLRIRRIRIEQQQNAGAAATGVFQINRLTTAGSAGTALTPRPFDTANTASGTGMTAIPSASSGTEGVSLFRPTVSLRAATNVGVSEDGWEWVQLANEQPIIIPAGAANGIAIKNLAAVAGATVNVTIEFVETSFTG